MIQDDTLSSILKFKQYRSIVQLAFEFSSNLLFCIYKQLSLQEKSALSYLTSNFRLKFIHCSVQIDVYSSVARHDLLANKTLQPTCQGKQDGGFFSARHVASVSKACWDSMQRLLHIVDFLVVHSGVNILAL